MARLFTSGLESGVAATEGLTLVNFATLATDRPYKGTYSLKCGGSGQYASTTSPTMTSATHYYFRAYINLDTLPSSGQTCQVYEMIGGPSFFVVQVIDTGAIGFLTSGGLTTRYTSAGAIRPDIWYLVEWRWMVSTSGNDECEMRLDGATALASQNAAWGNTIGTTHKWGNNGSGNVVSWYDDLAVNDNAGGAENSWLGTSTPQIARPDADTVTTGWTTTPLHSKLSDQSDATVITATLV